jgi:hypothetical protein
LKLYKLIFNTFLIQNYHPRRRLKVPEKKKKLGLLEQILQLPERLPKVPFLSSSVSLQSVDTGNSTTTPLEGTIIYFNALCNIYGNF